jgi:hypothetical protein
MLDVQVAIRLEDQMLTLLNMTTEGKKSLYFKKLFIFILEYDQLLDDEHTKLLQTQQFPSECQFIWNNVTKISINIFQLNRFFINLD